MRQTYDEIQQEKARLISAYNNHHLTWQELMEAINCLQYDALQFVA